MSLPSQPVGFATLHERPAVVTWFTVYTVGMGVMYLLCTVAGVLLLVYRPDLEPENDAVILGGILLVVGIPLMLAYFVAPFLPRKKWVWVYDLVLIAIGLSGCTVVASIPLLIFWLQGRCKEWFGMPA